MSLFCPFLPLLIFLSEKQQISRMLSVSPRTSAALPRARNTHIFIIAHLNKKTKEIYAATAARPAAGTLRSAAIISTNCSKHTSASCGPGDASGWYWIVIARIEG